MLRASAILVLLLFVPLTSNVGQAHHPFLCSDASGGEVVITRSGFQPHCVAIASGETVRWTNADLLGQDPGDERVGGSCFRARADTNDNIAFGQTYTVEFRWNAAESRVHVRAWDTNGDPVVYSDGSGNPTFTKRCGSQTHIPQPGGDVFVPYLSYSAEIYGGILIRT